MYVVIVTEKDGKIELTRDELQKMLDEAYAKGKADGTTITYPITTNPNPITNPNIVWTCSNSEGVGSNNV